MKFFIFLTLLIDFTFRFGDCDPNCDLIVVCSNFQFKRISEDQGVSKITGPPKNESEIAESGHWDGIVPEKYYLNLNFLNRTHYNGSVDILVKIVAPTNRISIHQHISNPIINYNLITIKPVCTSPPDSPPIPKAPPTTRCIDAAVLIESERVLVINFKNFQFTVDQKYLISFNSFEGETQDMYGQSGAIGLRQGSNLEDENPQKRYYASTTIFQMRYARTVFPCFDHPSLKAVFELCVERPDNMSVASNTLPIPGQESVTMGENRKKDCFESTPRIPTYIFTFSLMENYVSESIQVPNGGPKIEIFSPKLKINQLRWILNESVPVFQYMEKITKFKFPLKRLAFVVQYPAPFWGVENFGLITVDGAYMEEQVDTAYTILYHEIVHQWLGNVVTISDWKEICLQEGLTAYFEWAIKAKQRNESLEKKIDKERKANDEAKHYEPYALRDYAVTQDIANHCFGRPPLFFHTIAQREGFEVIERFLAELIKRKPFGTANLELWDEVMGDVTNGNYKGYIKGWFLEPGPLFLLTTQSSSKPDCLSIRQQVFGESTDKPAPVRQLPPRGRTVPTIPAPVPLQIASRPVPITIQTFGQSPTAKNFIFKEMTSSVCQIRSDSIYLLDPDANVLARKVYTANFYRRVLEAQHSDPNLLKSNQISNFIGDFCKSLLDDVLPIDGDSEVVESSEWLEIFRSIKNLSLPMSRACSCCLNSREENEKIAPCRWTWNQWCSDLRLNVILGRNYTFGRG